MTENTLLTFPDRWVPVENMKDLLPWVPPYTLPISIVSDMYGRMRAITPPIMSFDHNFARMRVRYDAYFSRIIDSIGKEN